MILKNSHGTELFVQVVFQGEHYGTWNQAINIMRDPIIVFYNYGALMSEPHRLSFRGQVVSSYYAIDLVNRNIASGLDLAGWGIKYTLTEAELAPIVELAKRLTERVKEWPPENPVGSRA
jgi:hypothetical protein